MNNYTYGAGSKTVSVPLSTDEVIARLREDLSYHASQHAHWKARAQKHEKTISGTSTHPDAARPAKTDTQTLRTVKR